MDIEYSKAEREVRADIEGRKVFTECPELKDEVFYNGCGEQSNSDGMGYYYTCKRTKSTLVVYTPTAGKVALALMRLRQFYELPQESNESPDTDEVTTNLAEFPDDGLIGAADILSELVVSGFPDGYDLSNIRLVYNPYTNETMLTNSVGASLKLSEGCGFEPCQVGVNDLRFD